VTTNRTPGLSKSRFVAGYQCKKLLWWRVHEPEAEELQFGIHARDIVEQGNEVGALARERFPGGVLIDPEWPYDEKLERTRAAMESGAPAIFEAAFRADRVYVAVDVLERLDDGWALIEVKSGSDPRKVKDKYTSDAAIQTHVLRRSGVDVSRVEIMHLNREYRHPGPADLFVRTDVTAIVEEMLPEIPDEIAAQLQVLAGDSPDIAFGEQCARVSDCPFTERCWPQEPDHVAYLSGKGVRKALELMERGIHRIQDIPDDVKLSDVNRRQRMALQENGVAVEPGLHEALDRLKGPVGFLDFETVGRAIPVWNGLGPWHGVPVQFSYHEEKPEGSYRHVEWLADGPADPREPLARALIEACRGAGHIVVYTGFESTQIRKLAEALPHLAAELEDIDRRLFDLKKAIKDNFYHPAFGGSFSIKDVLPALAPDLSYDDLEISDGQDASAEIARLMLRGGEMEPAERQELRQNLLAYCKVDTLAMVRLLEVLRELVRRNPPTDS
jgi:predicted RecB family nuclease